MNAPEIVEFVSVSVAPEATVVGVFRLTLFTEFTAACSESEPAPWTVVETSVVGIGSAIADGIVSVPLVDWN